MDEVEIGVVMDYFRPNLIEGAGAYTRSSGLRLDPRWSVRGDWMPSRTGWDGVLVNLVEGSETLKRLNGLGVPVVHLNGWFGDLARPRVEVDHAKCVEMAVAEFRELGIRRVAGLDAGRNWIEQRSYRGLRVALAKAGMEYLRLRRDRVKDLLEDVEVLAEDLCRVERGFGLFMMHAGVAFSLIDELAKRGVRVPEDVAIIVIDKDAQRTLQLAPVPLTGVVSDEWQQGYEAARLLHRMIRGESVGRVIQRVPPLRLERRESTGVEGSRDEVVAKALHLIRERWSSSLGVEELARMTGVSRRTLETKFRKGTGKTVHAALTARRMDEVKRLLGVADLSIAEVADRCGFSSVHYFTTAFKRETGDTPSAYRKAKQGVA